MCCSVLPPEIVMHDAYIGGCFRQTKITRKASDVTESLQLYSCSVLPPEIVMHDAYIGGHSENNIKCVVVHNNLWRKNRTTQYYSNSNNSNNQISIAIYASYSGAVIAGFLPHHWLYEWFSQFHSCGTYSVLSWSCSIILTISHLGEFLFLFIQPIFKRLLKVWANPPKCLLKEPLGISGENFYRSDGAVQLSNVCTWHPVKSKSLKGFAHLHNIKQLLLTMTSTITMTTTLDLQCASGCVVECWTCNREAAGSNLGRGYFAPRSTQPSIPSGWSVNEYQL